MRLASIVYLLEFEDGESLTICLQCAMTFMCSCSLPPLSFQRGSHFEAGLRTAMHSPSLERPHPTYQLFDLPCLTPTAAAIFAH